MQKLDKRNQRLKITISTRKKYLSSIQRGISEFIGSPEYDLEYYILVKDVETNTGDDPFVIVVISAVISGVVGAAVKSFFDWMRNRKSRERGFGHVRYKTLAIARCEARHDLEHTHNIHDYEEMEARKRGWNFLVTFRDNSGNLHSYSISPSCALRSYNRS